MKDKLIGLIELSLLQFDDLVAEGNKYFCKDKEPVLSTVKVLTLLKEEVQNNPGNIDERLLRAMRNVGLSSFRTFENTPLEHSIPQITGILRKEFPEYDDLEPLNRDFWKKE